MRTLTSTFISSHFNPHKQLKNSFVIFYEVILTGESIDVKDPDGQIGDGGNKQGVNDLEKPAKPDDTPRNKNRSKETGEPGKDKTII